MHVSTVYNNLDRSEIDEEIYPAKFDALKLLDFIDSVDDELLNNIKKQ